MMSIINLPMKRKALSLLILLITYFTGSCQNTTISNATSQQPFDGQYHFGLPFPGVLGVKFINNKTKSEVYEERPWDSDKQSNNAVRSIIIDGDCSVELCCIGITEENAGDYRYRVVTNDKEGLSNWIKPSVFITLRDKKTKYAYLGRFGYAPKQILKVEIYSVAENAVMNTMLVCWREIKPPTIWSYVQLSGVDPNAHGNRLYPLDMKWLKELKVKPNFIETRSSNDIKIMLGDSLQNLKFYLDNWAQHSYNYRITLQKEINGKKDSIDLGVTNATALPYNKYESSTFNLDKSFWDVPGKYKLTFTPNLIKIGNPSLKLVPDFASSYAFTILPANTRFYKVSVTMLTVILLAIIFIAIIVAIYYARQKIFLSKEIRNRKTAAMQLQSVRAQLNPHFIFNALAGIQNLMNKNEVEKANKYLARFARITRNILDNGQKELTSIEHEIDLLTDYLQMEQMRFGFDFKIEINENDIDQQIEIPAMLIQPFVENAVKHGVSELKDKGLIMVEIKKQDSTLLLIVQDNGKGFIDNNNPGMGIKLCEDRINLLNSIYKNSTILLQKSSGIPGTIIMIELKNWL